MYLRFGKGGAPVPSPQESLIATIQANMDVLGIWLAPEDAVGGASIADNAVALAEFSGSGEPDILSDNGGAGRHVFRTNDSPTLQFPAVVDMTDHFATEFLAIATALSTEFRCGGIIFKATDFSPGECSLFDLHGTHAAPFNTSDGDRKGTVSLVDYAGFVGSPPGVSGMPSIPAAGAGEAFFDGWGASTTYKHLQWGTVGAGAAHVRSYLSDIAGTFRGYEAFGTSDTFIETGDNTAVAGISTAMQIGHGGGHDVGVLKIACIYLGTDDAIDVSALQAIHEAIVDP